jgi:hypothetical protein
MSYQVLTMPTFMQDAAPYKLLSPHIPCYKRDPLLPEYWHSLTFNALLPMSRTRSRSEPLNDVKLPCPYWKKQGD